METHIYDEKNGLSYTLHGDYYLPNLVLNEEKPIYEKKLKFFHLNLANGRLLYR